MSTQQIETRLAEIRAMSVQHEVSADTSNLFSLREIKTKLADFMLAGELVRIEQTGRVLVQKRTENGWEDVAESRTEVPTWSAEKGWND